ncbi:MAG: hypothetical protein ACRDFX_00220, partial [Chloroflexota bacterium]
RMRDGVPEAQAEAEARSDQSLDQLIPVAPILPYSRLRFLTAPSIRGAQPLGFFPVIESHDPPIDEGYVDFTRTVPVSRNVLRGPFASMSEPARSMLRWKLAQFYALRNQSIGNEIMAAIGKTITDVHVVMDSKKRLVVDLELDQGASRLQLKQEPRALDPPAARLRST